MSSPGAQSRRLALLLRRFDLADVPASEKALRLAYYKRAKEVHPDSGLGDKDADFILLKKHYEEVQELLKAGVVPDRTLQVCPIYSVDSFSEFRVCLLICADHFCFLPWEFSTSAEHRNCLAKCSGKIELPRREPV